MSKARDGGDSTPRSESADEAAFGVGDWLGLAAAPAFAVMALLTVVSLNGHAASPSSGMAVMYALMSLSHLTPWLRLVPGRRIPLRRSRPPSAR